jgi:hypothetical protein
MSPDGKTMMNDEEVEEPTVHHPPVSEYDEDESSSHASVSGMTLKRRASLQSFRSSRNKISMTTTDDEKVGAMARVEHLTCDSCLTTENNWEYPSFQRNELVLRKELGKGSFSLVEEIRAFVFLPSQRERWRRIDSCAMDDKESRQFIAEHCIRSTGDARYAIKSLRSEVISDPNKCWVGITDLVIETHFLRRLEHPNIIKLRGVGGGDPFSQDYFLVLDRLYATLTTRLVEWKRRKKRAKSAVGYLFDPRRTIVKTVFGERLLAAGHLCGAIEYLHERKICHRDIKPENIGFDIVSNCGESVCYDVLCLERQCLMLVLCVCVYLIERRYQNFRLWLGPGISPPRRQQ